jgi:MFS family permease
MLKSLFLWSLTMVLPLAVMPTIFNFGLSIFANSTSADSWAYVAVADYLSTVVRGTDGGLSSLHQFAASFSTVRNASSVLLAFLANGLGTRSDQSMVIFCIIVVFANASALAAFAQTLFGKTTMTAALVLLAGFAIPAIIIHYGNFDQLLLLPILPVIAALAFRAGNDFNLTTTSFLIGFLGAAAFLAYVELAFFGVAVALTFFLPPRTAFHVVLIRISVLAAIAAPTFLLFASPGLIPLLDMLNYQIVAARSITRPGDSGQLTELISRLGLFDAMRSLPAQVLSPTLILLVVAIGLLSVFVIAAGAWSERRHWARLVGLAVIGLAAAHFLFDERYVYAVYKIVTVNFWMIGFFAVAGGTLIHDRLVARLPQRLRSAPAIAAAIFALTFVAVVTKYSVHQFDGFAERQNNRREILTIAQIVGRDPTLLSVRNDVANEWAVFYLIETPLLIDPYKSYMAGAVSYMVRAMSVDPSSIRFIITEHDDSTAPVGGARRIWDGNVYSLWQKATPG